MAALADLRKLPFQNASSGKIYEVTLFRNVDESITFTGYLVGTKSGGFGGTTFNQTNDDPAFDNANEVSGVVLTANIADVFGKARRTDAYLVQASIFNSSNPAGSGALLSTICV